MSFELPPNRTQAAILHCLTYAAWKLWNVANYERKNWSKESGTPYPDWYHQKKNLKHHFWYRNLPSQSAQEVLKQLDEAWRSFFTLRQTGGVDHPRPPRFKHKPFNVRFLNNGFVVEGHRLRLTIPRQTKQYLRETYGIYDNFLYVKIPSAYRDQVKRVKMIEVAPGSGRKYKLTILCEKDPVKPLEAPSDVWMSIDQGINNLLTCYVSTGKTFIISGRQLLSTERYFAKTISHYQGIHAAQQSARGVKYTRYSQRVGKLFEKRNKQVAHIIHAATKTVAEIAVSEGVTRVVVGDITDIREGKNYGAVTNQKMHRWPFRKIKEQLAYKLKDRGIAMDVQEESYSSQCSPFTAEVAKEYAKKRNRKYRGLYVADGQSFNADALGAYNSLRKYLGRLNSTSVQPPVVGLDSPTVYRWNKQRFTENPKLAI